jgi:predicted  nucleic acid-binding Zn-ribbon protein
MKSALSHNEIVILDRQAATLSYQLSEIAGLLESRLGETSELATSARNAQREFAQFEQRIRRRVALSELGRPESDSQTA